MRKSIFACLISIAMFLCCCTAPTNQSLESAKAETTFSEQPPTVGMTAGCVQLESTVPESTPLPTLIYSEAQLLISNLKENNGNCQLPCFWGISPGYTSIFQADSFLRSFATNIPPPLKMKNGHYGESFGFTNPDGTDFYVGLYGSNEGTVLQVAAPSFYSFSDLLISAGTPDEIWFWSTVTPMGTPIIVFDVVYFNRGTVIEYYQEYDGEYALSGENWYIKVCPDDIKRNLVSLFLSSPNEPFTFDDFIQIVGGEYKKKERKVEDISNMTPQSFFEAFSDPGDPHCFESPMELWP